MRAILTYHSIDSSRSPISVSREQFARHVTWLASGHVRVTSVGELLTLPDDVNAVALTFDDGFLNFGEIAAPMLAEHGLTATVFVVADHVGRTNAWHGTPDPGIPSMPLLGWDALARLREYGVQVGAHTRTHVRLATIRGDRLASEVCAAAEIIARYTGAAPEGFAYPYGSFSDAAVELVQSSYDWACTTTLRTVSADDPAPLLPRLDMYYFRERGRLESWGSVPFTCYLALRAGARGIRQRLAASRNS